MTTSDEYFLEESASERFRSRTEYQSTWLEIFRDLDWLDSILSTTNLIPALVGWDMQYMQPESKLEQPPLIALALAKPTKEKVGLDHDLERFLSTLHDHQYHEHLWIVEFPKFNLYIGCIVKPRQLYLMDMHDATCLLQPDSTDTPPNHKTLVLYYDQDKARCFPLSLDVEFDRGCHIWILDRDRMLLVLSVTDSVGYENWAQEDTRGKTTTVQ
ncbi:uncharacterized protein BKA55DRAFT_545014 [Fusarium redolens]|uniref:Uncharacterized protein n=1 Tax=Fusarium redolens TaxID=48865 RepID=A0A9P9G116_FUSRE|nr:uncharacterized protein BKA55DRAFT_545014 [Fusarium redolens]KAH7231280.1 hypothetical protein BKA55DRAFT_545014 [Fusarium redolens]